VELPLPDYQVLYDHPRVNQRHPRPVREVDESRLFTPAFAAVETADADLGLDVAVEGIATTAEIVGRDGRVVAYLLHVERTPSNPALVRLAQNRVEGLLHTDTQRAIRYCENDTAFESLEGV
jgi:hypothetical protein